MRAVEPFTIRVTSGGDVRSDAWMGMVEVQRTPGVLDAPLPETVTLRCGEAGTVTSAGFVGPRPIVGVVGWWPSPDPLRDLQELPSRR
jgi:hypothetical protein